MRIHTSDDEMLELLAISNGLSSEEVFEDGNNDVVGVVRWVLDDGVGEEEDDSDVFEAVGGEEEGNSVPFNNISNLDGGLVLVALVEHFLSFFHKGEDFDLEVEIFLLNKKIITPLSCSSLASISGLMVSRTLAVHLSSLATALSLSRGLTAKRQTRSAAKMMAFMLQIE